MKLKINICVDILGASYFVHTVSEEEDSRMIGNNGFTDWTTKEICIEQDWTGNIGNKIMYIKQVILHEIIHAFMYESGFGDCFVHKEMGQEETVVDWFAAQMNKIMGVASKIYGNMKSDEII